MVAVVDNNYKIDSPDWEKAEELFRTRYHYAVSSAHGMERLAYKVLPYSLIRSFSLTFDPVSQFRLGQQYVSPTNRIRTRLIKSVLDNNRGYFTINDVRTSTLAPNTSTCQYVPIVQSHTITRNRFSSNSQPPLKWTSADSTRRTRSYDQAMGAFELFRYDLKSPMRATTYRWVQHTYVIAGSCYLSSHSHSQRVERRHTDGSAATFPNTSIDGLKSAVATKVAAAMQANVLAMVKDASPAKARYSLAREVIELKDLPRSVVSLRNTVVDLRAALSNMSSKSSRAFYGAKLAQHVPDEYLSFWFGWLTTLRAVRELLEAPARISKEFNFLLGRNGLPTTVRRNRKMVLDGITTPGWSYNPTAFNGTLWNETVMSTSTETTVELELKLVINRTFQFPEVGVPILRREFYAKKIGLVPTISDVYNLVPWTWLIDWFIGLGNYVELVDVVNQDQSHVNWGLLTGVASGVTRTTHKTYHDNGKVISTNYHGVANTTTTYERQFDTHSSDCAWRYHVRKDIVAAYNVPSTLKPSTLSTYQQSIIGALLAQRTGKAKR